MLKNARQAKMQYGEEPQKPTSKRFRRNLGSPPLLRRDFSLVIQNNLVPIGAVEMVIAASLRGAISLTTGHKVVVKGPEITEKEKGKEVAKERDEGKEKAMEKEKDEEDEAGHLDLLR